VTLIIRRALSEADLAAAADAGARSAQGAFTWRPLPLTQPLLRKLMHGEDVWLALQEETVVGMLSLYPPDFVHFLFVVSEAKNKGVGRALLSHVRTHAGVALRLKVDTANSDAIAFYEHLGCGRIDTGADSHGEDEGIAWVGYRLD